jgi:FixJ family two-component response regulator
VAEKLVITIVDDDQSVRDGITDLVKAMGFDAETFERAEDFLNSARVEATSCLITDMRMPGMSGFDLHDHLVASGKPIPTIMITAFPQDADRGRALQAGIVCYLAKPCEEGELVACINSALDSGAAGRRGS